MFADGFPVFEDLSFDFANLDNAVPETLSFLDIQVGLDLQQLAICTICFIYNSTICTLTLCW